jgi:hypothetical protein
LRRLKPFYRKGAKDVKVFKKYLAFLAFLCPTTEGGLGG